MTTGLGRRDRWRSLTWLLLCLGVLIGGSCMEVRPEGVTLAGICGPECPIGSTIGERFCPGCGLTRATALTLQGEMESSLAVHPAGVVVALFSLLAVLLHGHILLTRRRGSRHDRYTRLGYRVFLAALFLSWMYRML